MRPYGSLGRAQDRLALALGLVNGARTRPSKSASGCQPEYRNTANRVSAPLLMVPAPLLRPSNVMTLIVVEKNSAPTCSASSLAR